MEAQKESTVMRIVKDRDGKLAFPPAFSKDTNGRQVEIFRSVDQNLPGVISEVEYGDEVEVELLKTITVADSPDLIRQVEFYTIRQLLGPGHFFFDNGEVTSFMDLIWKAVIGPKEPPRSKKAPMPS